MVRNISRRAFLSSLGFLAGCNVKEESEDLPEEWKPHYSEILETRVAPIGDKKARRVSGFVVYDFNGKVISRVSKNFSNGKAEEVIVFRNDNAISYRHIYPGYKYEHKIIPGTGYNWVDATSVLRKVEERVRGTKTR